MVCICSTTTSTGYHQAYDDEVIRILGAHARASSKSIFFFPFLDLVSFLFYFFVICIGLTHADEERVLCSSSCSCCGSLMSLAAVDYYQ